MSAEDLQEIHRALQEDQVYVHPSMVRHLPPAAEAELSAALADLEDPTYVVVWPYSRSDEYGGKPADLLTRLHQAHPEPGVYLSNEQRVVADEYSHVTLEGRQWGVPGERDGEVEPYSVLALVRLEEHPDLHSALDRTVEVLAMPPEELATTYDTLSEERFAEYRAENPATDGDGGVPDPVVTGGVVLLAMLVVAVLTRRLRARHRPAPKLPPSALARVREARDRGLRARAQQASLTLGEALDEHEIAPRDDRAAWQAALDHYAAARRLAEQPDPPLLDVVGAIVLCERGTRALEQARRGRAFKPVRPCFLNPLHGAARDDQPLEMDGRAVTVPVCRQCHAALGKGRAPDILDVVHRGAPRHWFETDAEPWVSTGYGALEPDLVTALQRRR